MKDHPPADPLMFLYAVGLVMVGAVYWMIWVLTAW